MLSFLCYAQFRNNRPFQNGGTMPVAPDEILDVAIVGGGVAGTYCAWRLSHDAPPTARGDRPTIALFEGSDRIGGRLLSLTPPGMPHLVAEMGGMRYLSTHPLVSALVEKKLRLEHRPVSTVGAPDPTLEQCYAYLRDTRLQMKDLTDPAKVPYQLADHEKGQNPNALIGYALNKLSPELSKLSGQALIDYLQTATIEGRPLHHWGFWNLLDRALSSEAFDFARDCGGFDFYLLNLNAVNMIREMLGVQPGTVFNQVIKGYEQVPLTLCKRFQQAGGQVLLQHRLQAFDTALLPDGSPGVKLTFQAESHGWGPFAGGEPRQVYARSLILAMPRRALELLDPTGKVLNRSVYRLIQSVTPVPMLKIWLCYETPWWETLGLSQGHAITDLPIRQCWYWGVEGDQPGADPTNRHALILAAFDDTLNADFWAGLRDVEHLPRFTLKSRAEGRQSAASRRWAAYRQRATGLLVDEVHLQLMEVHGMTDAPKPYDAAFIDWAEDPYGGAIHAWNINTHSWELAPKLTQPHPPAPVYICGEAYSQNQGWVEGALETAETVLQSHFHLAAPDWVKS